MKSKYVNGTINKDIYIHPDAETRQEIEEIKAVNQRQDEEINTLGERKQDKLTAGENITISEDNVISADAQPGAFEVIYGETLFEDIFNAYHSGNIPVCTINTQTFYVSMMYGSSAQTGYAVFTNSQGSYTSNFDVVYPSTYSQIRTSYLESTANLVQTISADSTASQYPSARAVWNQAVKYTKLKRFLAHTELTQIVLDTNTAADIYNAINAQSGGQVVTVFNKDTSILYTITRAYIDENYQINISGESSHIQKNGNSFTLYHDYIVMQGIDTNQTFYNFTKQEILS